MRPSALRSGSSPWASGVRNGFVALFLVGTIATSSFQAGYRPLPSPESWALAEPTTVQEILDGKYRTSTDKHGTRGLVVQVSHVRIYRTFHVSDGDWHIHGIDSNNVHLVMEIIPRDLPTVGIPPQGVPLTLVGVPFCDRGHEDQQWHYTTCWELHPILGWRIEPATIVRAP